MTTTTITIDCHTCPVRGRHCGDCFVPVLGHAWLAAPSRREPDTPGPPAEETAAGPGPGTVPLDGDELSAVGAFVRAGLVRPEEASRARAWLTGDERYAVG